MTRERLLRLKDYVKKHCCEGRLMKTPGSNMRLDEVKLVEPNVFVCLPPTNLGRAQEEGYIPANVHPCIMIAFGPSKGRDMEEQRFDRYNKVFRPEDLGQTLSASILFCVYEPGNRLEGFSDGLTLMEDGTEDGFFTLTDWMDELVSHLLADGRIPGSDLFVDTKSITYSPLIEMGYITDKRPFWYGFVTCTLYGYAHQAPSGEIKNILD